jgi:predicted negative regulator of RcsB-dependent stress response
LTRLDKHEECRAVAYEGLQMGARYYESIEDSHDPDYARKYSKFLRDLRPLELRDVSRSLEVIRKAADSTNYQNVAVLHELSTSLEANGRLEEAVETLTHALTLPMDARYTNQLMNTLKSYQNRLAAQESETRQ